VGPIFFKTLANWLPLMQKRDVPQVGDQSGRRARGEASSIWFFPRGKCTFDPPLSELSDPHWRAGFPTGLVLFSPTFLTLLAGGPPFRPFSHPFFNLVHSFCHSFWLLYQFFSVPFSSPSLSRGSAVKFPIFVKSRSLAFGIQVSLIFRRAPPRALSSHPLVLPWA